MFVLPLLITVLTWGSSGVIIKRAYAENTLTQVLVAYMIAMSAILVPYGIFSGADLGALTLPAITSAASGIAYIGQLEAYRRAKVGIVSTLVSTAPLFAILLAFTFRGERLSPMQLLAVFGVIGGVVLVSRSRLTGDRRDLLRAAPFILLPIFGYGFNHFFTKVAFVDRGGSLFFAQGTVRPLLMGAYVSTARAQQGKKAAILPSGPLVFLGAAFSAVGDLAFAVAISLGQVSIVSPLSSTTPIVAALLARLLLKERLERVQYMGIVVAVASIIAVLAQSI